MSIAIKYVDLELCLAEVFGRVAERGFVMPTDRQVIKSIFVGSMHNACTLWEEQVPCRSLSFFDAHTLSVNPHFRHDMSLSFVHYQILEEQKVRPEDARIETTLDTIAKGASDVSCGLMELAENDDFTDILAHSNLRMAERLMAYAEQRAGRSRDTSTAPPQIPELDKEAAEYSEMLRVRLCTLLHSGDLPRPAL